MHTMLRVTLRTTPCMMLRVMLVVTVPLAHDAAQPLPPNLSCPFLLSTSLVHISASNFWLREKTGGFSRRSVLGTLDYSCVCKLRFSSWRCESALSEHHIREAAMFELELRECASHATFARKHLRLCSRSWSCCGNALRVQLWPEPGKRTSRTTFALKSCDFAAPASSRTFQPKHCGSALRVLLLAAPPEMLFMYYLGT